MRYQGVTTHKHGFESAAVVELDRGEQAGRLATNIREVVVAATADKEHIQQMTTHNDDLLKVVRKQQDQIDKQQTQIDELLKQNGELINKIGTNTNTGDATSGGAENTYCGRYYGNRNTNGNGNRNTNSNDTGSDAVSASDLCDSFAIRMWNILCDFFVVSWNLSPVLPQVEVAPVSNTAELLFPRIDVTYEFDDCLCNEPSSLT